MTPTQPPEGDGRITLPPNLPPTMAEEITDGMLQWKPGTLSTAIMNRVLMDVLADVWQDCYRRGEAHAIRVARFRERIARARYAATGEGELR